MADRLAVECPKCGHNNKPAAKRCANCGLDLEWARENWDKCVSGPAESDPPLILVSDDEISAVTLYRILLEREGYRVAKAHDAYETLELTNHLRPDLIITDFAKPGMNGAEMIARLKSDPALRDIPAMVVSSHADKDSVRMATEAGAIRHLSKPINFSDFTAAVASVLAEG
jgi:CheY-like chemotaxis protein